MVSPSRAGLRLLRGPGGLSGADSFDSLRDDTLGEFRFLAVHDAILHGSTVSYCCLLVCVLDLVQLICILSIELEKVGRLWRGAQHWRS